MVNGLRQNGFAADHASDGEKGLALAQAVTYDAAVLDVMLPKLDGLSLLRQLRQLATQPESLSVPLLALMLRLRCSGLRVWACATGRTLHSRPFI
ncbi:MAG: response regulator [Limisphaerales bacterium]